MAYPILLAMYLHEFEILRAILIRLLKVPDILGDATKSIERSSYLGCDIEFLRKPQRLLIAMLRLRIQSSLFAVDRQSEIRALGAHQVICFFPEAEQFAGKLPACLEQAESVVDHHELITEGAFRFLILKLASGFQSRF